MEIGSLSNKSATPRPAQSGMRQPAGDKERTVSDDSIEISSEARSKLASSADEARRKEISERTEKLERVRQRMESDYYSQSEVVQDIANKVIGDIE